MAIAFDAVSNSAEVRTTGTGHANPVTWTHTPVGTPKGVVVFILSSGTNSNDIITGPVTYGGVTCSHVAHVDFLVSEGAGEPGSAYAYFLGSGIPTGAQTVSVAYDDSNSAFKVCVAVTVTASSNTEVIDFDTLEGIAANPGVTLDSASRTAIRLLGMFSGRQDTSIDPGTGLTEMFAMNAEGGISRSYQAARETTPSSGATALSFTATSDDIALVGVALGEIAATSASAGHASATGIARDPTVVSSRTLYASANSGGLLCQHGTYATARSGAGTLSITPANDARLGQRFAFGTTYYCWEYGLEFDLSSLPAGAIIQSATLSLWLTADDSATDFTIEARKFDYGAAYTTADFVAGASISSSTLVAQRSTSGIGADGAYKALTDVAMVANLTVGTTNRFLIASSLQKDGTTPTGSEYITSYYDNNGGDDKRPKLDITYITSATTAGHSSGTGAASQPSPGVRPTTSTAAVTGSANAALIVSSGAAQAGHAAATGWASQGEGSDLSVDPQAAESVSEALDATKALASSVGLAGAAGQAYDALSVPSTSVSAGHASAAASAPAGSIRDGTHAPLTGASGDAYGSGMDLGIGSSLASPNADVSAYDATVATVSGTIVTAGAAEATGAAQSSGVMIAARVGLAAAIGVAHESLGVKPRFTWRRVRVSLSTHRGPSATITHIRGPEATITSS